MAEESRSSNRTLIIVLAVGALVLALGVGIIAAAVILGGEDAAEGEVAQSAALMPEDTFMFAAFNPHLDQAENFEVIEKVWGDSPLIETGLGEILSSMEKDGVSYKDDIEPWLGDEISFGMMGDLAGMMFLGVDIYGKTLGVVGAGRIGDAVARRSVGFNMKVLYYDVVPNEGLERDIGAQRVELDELLKEADFVSIHVPLMPATTHFIGERELKLMKKTAVLINNSRGPVVDEKALVEALKSGGIAYAGLDVFEDEPELAPGLAELDNVTLTPHTSSATVETRTKMGMLAAENAIAIIEGRKPPNIVNPEVLE